MDATEQGLVSKDERICDECSTINKVAAEKYQRTAKILLFAYCGAVAVFLYVLTISSILTFLNK